MAQTTLNIYASDQIFKCVDFMLRWAGIELTLWPIQLCHPSSWYIHRRYHWNGLLVHWYVTSLYALESYGLTAYLPDVGAGNGNGNPYGLAAIVGVILFFFVFLRLFAPPQYLTATLMAGVRVHHVLLPAC